MAVNPESIAKLAVALDSKRQRVVIKHGNDALDIVGIEDEILGDCKEPYVALFRTASILNPNDLELRILSPGKLTATVCGNTLMLTAGKCEDKSPLFELPNISASARNVLRDPTLAVILQPLAQILDTIRNLGHGGGIIMLPNDTRIPNPPIEPKFVVSSGGICDSMTSRMEIEKAVMLAHLSNGRQDKTDLIASRLVSRIFEDELLLDRKLSAIANLASMDGYVVINAALAVLAFGARVSVNQRSADLDVQTVVQVHSGALPEIVNGSRRLNDFGTRHRAAYEAVDQIDNALAFVVSQDGDLRIFDKEDGCVRCMTCIDTKFINTNRQLQSPTN